MPTDLGTIARPDLPKPRCRVMLVCGPPAAGKSTYVDKHAGPADTIIDLDTIARELGYGRERPANATAEILQERNARLRRLARTPPHCKAWVIIGAPSVSLRMWWADALNVRPGDLILLNPGRIELRRRIDNDPDRVHVRAKHYEWVDKWLAREREDDPGIIKRGCGPDGFPLDPLHSWNR